MLPIELLIKGTALIGVVFAVASLLRNASAATRHLVWTCGLLGMLLLPLLLAMPWRMPVVPALTERAVVGWPDASPSWAGEAGAGTAAPTATTDPTWSDEETATAASPSGAEAATDRWAAGEEASAIAGPSHAAGSTIAGPAATGPTEAASAPAGEGWLDRLGSSSRARG